MREVHAVTYFVLLVVFLVNLGLGGLLGLDLLPELF